MKRNLRLIKKKLNDKSTILDLKYLQLTINSFFGKNAAIMNMIITRQNQDVKNIQIIINKQCLIKLETAVKLYSSPEAFRIFF